MREQLAQWAGRRHTYRATFTRLGTMPGAAQPIVYRGLVRDLKDVGTGRAAADHAWLPVTAAWPALQPGDRIEFSAIPWCYQRGYLGRMEWLRALRPQDTDYHLVALRDIRCVGRDARYVAVRRREEVAS